MKPIEFAGEPGGITKYLRGERRVGDDDGNVDVIEGSGKYGVGFWYVENCLLEAIELRKYEAEAAPVIVSNAWNSTLRNIAVMQGKVKRGY